MSIWREVVSQKKRLWTAVKVEGVRRQMRPCLAMLDCARSVFHQYSGVPGLMSVACGAVYGEKKSSIAKTVVDDSARLMPVWEGRNGSV